jgi:membrane fusion protein, multidrug efflux system
MKWELSDRLRRWLLVPPLLAGVAAVGVLVFFRATPQRADESEARRTMRVLEVAAVDVTPRAFGHGTAQPGQVWRAVAEVRGRVIEVHPQLRPGAMIAEGELLLRIDPAEYELAVARLEAEIAQAAAQLDELAVAEANERASLEIEQASLALAERELARLHGLHQRNVITITEVEQQSRSVLAQRQSVQKLGNSLRMIPQQKKTLEATLAAKRAGLAQAELDLGKTVIDAPFALRLAEVNIEPGQFLAAGQALFEAHGTARTEIEAQIPLDQLRNLIDPEHGVPLPLVMDEATIGRLFNFAVIVRFRSGDFQAEWQGRVARLREQFDPRTRTIGLVVVVDRPYEKAVPGKRPPLVQGMFCEVELRGAVRRGQIVVPRAALHDGHVFVLDGDSRLRRRPVDVAFVQGDFAGLQGGLEEGERLVVSDPAPAIDGLLVDPVADERLGERLAAAAAGEARRP